MTTFSPGKHRPIYMWAGPATIRMNRLKFMGAAVDEAVHNAAHTHQGAEIVSTQTGFNWAYLMYDWGFPPEIVAEDFLSFQQAVTAYHDQGVKVFAYIQSSNCVYQGSFTSKDWYALDPSGDKIHYYTGRYMTCWQNPAWNAHLEQLVRSAVATGTDGVFFDNPWYGEQLLNLGGVWYGGAGCYCPRCQQAYQTETGHPIPTTFFSIKDEQSTYLRWRANQATSTLRRLANLAHNLRPDIVISINDFDAVMRPGYLIYGIDLPALAKIQDVIMIEDYGLPRYEVHKQPHWVNNVLTIHTASAICGSTPISVDPYDRGIGFDSVFPPRRYQQGIAEAAACGASMVVKGTEFYDNGKFTLLTAPQFNDTRTQIKKYHVWLEENQQLFSQRFNSAKVGVVYPGDALWKNWFTLSPCFFGVGQALLALGIPWRVVSQPSDLQGLDCLITCDQIFTADWGLPDHLKVIALSSLPGWVHPSFRKTWQNPALLKIVSCFLTSLYKNYFESPWFRKVLDGLGVMRLITTSPLFDIPPMAQLQRLSSELPVRSYLKSSVPVLVETWQQAQTTQIHFVNYTANPITLELEFPYPVSGYCISPDRKQKLEVKGTQIALPLDIYNLLLVQPDPPTP